MDCVCVCAIVSHIGSSITEAFYAPVRSLTLKHILNFGKKKKKSKINLFTLLLSQGSLWKKEKRKKRMRGKKNLLHLRGQPKSSQ